MAAPSITLIIPPSVFLLDERVFMSLGILKVASALEKVGHSVSVLDLSGVSNYREVMAEHAKRSKSGLFGITATTPQLPQAFIISNIIRENRKKSKLILGGPHITLVAAAFKREKSKQIVNGRAAYAFKQLVNQFDVLVAGDGEHAIFAALDPNCSNYIDADDPKTPFFLKKNELDELPFPARHLVDVASYKYTIENVPALSLIAQLGCPFACGFCGGRYAPFLRRVRQRTSENIVKEIHEMYQNYGTRGFMLYDDELNVNPKMVELMNQISDLQKREKTEFRLRGFVKAELFTDEQAKAMYRAGFRWLLTGFESGSPRILKNINKKATREDNTRAVEIAKRNGLKVKALMSLGHPGESEETVKDTYEWLLEVKPDDFDMTIITTYAGTPYYDDAVLHDKEKKIWVYEYNGDRLYSDEVDYFEKAKYYKGDPKGGYQAFVFTDYLSREDIVKWREFSEKKVRKDLNIPFPKAVPAIRYEHSMGQSGSLPNNILRKSRSKKAKKTSPVSNLLLHT